VFFYPLPASALSCNYPFLPLIHAAPPFWRPPPSLFLLFLFFCVGSLPTMVCWSPGYRASCWRRGKSSLLRGTPPQPVPYSARMYSGLLRFGVRYRGINHPTLPFCGSFPCRLIFHSFLFYFNITPPSLLTSCPPRSFFSAFLHGRAFLPFANPPPRLTVPSFSTVILHITDLLL